jgi:hypothetical protein
LSFEKFILGFLESFLDEFLFATRFCGADSLEEFWVAFLLFVEPFDPKMKICFENNLCGAVFQFCFQCNLFLSFGALVSSIVILLEFPLVELLLLWSSSIFSITVRVSSCGAASLRRVLFQYNLLEFPLWSCFS